jgi:transcriptional regulator with XRE-family HTH domain
MPGRRRQQQGAGMKHTEEISDLISCIIGTNIARKREELGISLAELSKHLDAPLEELVALEAGQRRPDPRMLVTLARRLNVSLGYFFSLPETLAFGGEINGSDDLREKPALESAAVVNAFARVKNNERRNIVLDIGQAIAKFDSDI